MTVAHDASLHVAHRILEAIAQRGVAHVVLTGGTDGNRVTNALAQMSEIPWDHVHLWWGDERLVPVGDVDRNEGHVAAEQFPGANFHRMPSSADSDPVGTYRAELNALGQGPFDVVMLGMGPDGHVASLFPGRFDPDDCAAVREVTDSPKPPPRRLTLTLSRLNNCRHMVLLASGEAKKAAVEAVRAGAPGVPAAMVSGRESTTLFTDQ